MEKIFNMLFAMPFEFQIGLMVALIFLIFSQVLQLFQRDNAMMLVLFISFFAFVIFCRLPMVPWWGHILGTFFMYSLILIFQLVQSMKATVREHLKKEWKLFSSDYEVVTADLSEFTRLDLNYYKSTQRELESLGFKKIRDYESLPYTKAFPELRTFTRSFNNIDCDICGDVVQNFYVKPKKLIESIFDLRLVRFTTEFSDGTFLETTNGLGVNPIQDVEGFTIQQFLPDISLETLLNTHEEELENICETKKVDAVLHRTVEEVHATKKRKFLLLCKDRLKKRGLTTEECVQFIKATSHHKNSGAIMSYVSEYNKQVRKIARKQRQQESE
jgi:Ca2+/Na+ antiporter